MPSPKVEVPSLEQVYDEIRAQLPAGFPINNTDPYGVYETYLRLAAQGIVDVRRFLAELLPQFFVLTASGGWLDLHAADVKTNRIPARFAEGLVDCHCDVAGIVPAGTIVQTEADPLGQRLRYLVTASTPIEPPMTRVPVRAESPGAAWNVSGGQITTLVTVLDFVESVTNAGDWLTQSGVDLESDDLLRERLLLMWPALGTGSTWHAYKKWAREVQGVVKVAVLDQHPRGQGTVDVVIAPGLGMPEPALIDEVQAYIDERRPITADVLVRAPDALATDVTLTIHLRDTADGTDLAAWEARVRSMMDRLDVGEIFYPSLLGAELHQYASVEGVEISVPTDPVVPEEAELIAAGTIAVTVVVP
jgi:uncharacterized phage protein gp47/JayE